MPRQRCRHDGSPPSTGWRAWIAFAAAIAVTWPSLGPLPWVAGASSTLEARHATHNVDGLAHDAAHGAAQHHESSGIPGSPAHPADHDCAQCQVLKHLARCAPPAAAPTSASLQPDDAPAPLRALTPHRAARVASLPPVRGPPPGIA